MDLKIFAETNLFNAGTSFEDKKLSYEQAGKLESTIKKNLEHLDKDSLWLMRVLPKGRPQRNTSRILRKQEY